MPSIRNACGVSGLPPCAFRWLPQGTLVRHNWVQRIFATAIRVIVNSGLFVYPIGTAALIAAAVRAPWMQFRDTAFQHVFLGACVAVLFLWRMRAGIVPAVPIHLLCVTTLTLMFGVPLATIAAAILTSAMCVMGFQVWASWAGSFLVFGVVPILITWLSLNASRRYLPPNPFVYIFVCAFFGAAVAMLAAMAANSVLLLGAEQISLTQLRDSYVPVLPLMMFPEAFINGLIVTGLVVFKPAWIASFDDEVYLKS